MEKLIKGLLGTVYKMPETEVAELLKTEADEPIDEEKILKIILEKDQARISKIKTDSSANPAKWNEAVGKATKDVWSKVEKSLKDEFDVDSELKGEELLSFISESAKEKMKASGQPGTITDDDVKKHPVYVKAENDFKKKIVEKDNEMKTAVEAAEAAQSRKEFIAKMRKAALIKFKDLSDVILPTDAQKAEKQIQKLLIDELDAYEFQDDGNDSFLPLYKEGDKKGNRVEDGHANAIGFDALIEKIAKSNFEFKVATDRDSPGNGKPKEDEGKNAGKKLFTGKAPANKQEYIGLLTDTSLTTEQKLEIKADNEGKF